MIMSAYNAENELPLPSPSLLDLNIPNKPVVDLIQHCSLHVEAKETYIEKY